MSVARVVVWSLAFAACVAAGFYYGALRQPDAVETGPARIGLITASEDAFHQAAVEGAKEAAKELGAELTVLVPRDRKEQTTFLARIDMKSLDGVAVSLLSPRTQTRLLSLLASEVPVVTYDNDAPMSLRHMYIGTDNYSGGQLAARVLKEAMPDGGDVAIFIGDVDRNNARDRRLGFLDELMGRTRDDNRRFDVVDKPLEGGGYRIVGTYLDDHDEGRCAKNVERVLAENEGLTALVGLYGYSAPVCARVVQEQGLGEKVKVVGFDSHSETLEGIDSGVIAGTVVQDPRQYGYEAIRMLSDWKGDTFNAPTKGGLAPTLIPCQIVNRENLAKFRDRMGASDDAEGA